MLRGIVSLARMRRAGVWLALIALALRIAVPAGFMVAADSNNRLTVTLCSGHGPVAAAIDLATGQIVANGHGAGSGDRPAQPDADAQQTQPCHFAVAAVTAPAPQEVSVSAPIAAIAAFPRPAREVRPQIVPTRPPLPAL
jgi:hypothetical protein